MIGIFCFFFLALLAVRSLVLAIAESKPWIIRIADLVLVLLFGGSAVILSFFVDWPEARNPWILLLLIAAVLLGLSLRWRLRRPYESRPAALLFKILFVLLLICVSLLVLMMTGFVHLIEDQPVLKVTMPGNSKKEFVEWKNPEGELQGQNLDTYEVVFDTPEGKRIADLFLYGDQVAVKARIIRFRPVLNLIGFHNLCRIEYVYNGYTTAERFNQYPHRAQEIPAPHPILSSFQEGFWGFWKQSYYQENTNWWIKSSTLESSYFPLVGADSSPFRGSYFLTVTPGGLSSVPLP